MKKFTIPMFAMNLQFFAEDTGAGQGGTPAGDPAAAANPAGAGDPGDDSDDGDPAAGDKKYTDEEVNEIINRKFAKWQKDQDEKASQAEKLKHMSAEDQANAKATEAEKKAAELQNKLDAYNMRDTARAMFAKQGVEITDADLDLVVTADADTTKANVKQFVDFAKRATVAAEREFLNGDHLKKGSGKPDDKGSRGAEVAKLAMAGQPKNNPYFKN